MGPLRLTREKLAMFAEDASENAGSYHSVMILTFLRNVSRVLGTRLLRRPALAKAMTNTGWLIGEKGVRLGLGLLVWVWIARYLGPQDFGTYMFALAFVGLFGVVATLGLDRIVVREIVHDPSCTNEILGSSFILRLVSGTCGLLLSFLAIYFVRPDDPTMRWLVAIAGLALVFQAFSVIDLWFQSQVIAKYSVWARSVAFVIVAVILMTLVFIHAPLIAFAWVVLGETILGMIGLVLVYVITGHRLMAWQIRTKRVIALISESWPLIVSGLAIMIYMKIDQVMIGVMIDDNAVGVYSAAARVSEFWYFIPMAIVSSLTPALIEAKKSSEDVYYRSLRKLFYLMSALAFAIAIPMTFFSGFVIRLLFGQAYSAAGTVLAVHIWAAIFVFLGVAQSVWTISEGLAKLLMVRTLMGAGANVLLNFILIPKYGPLGAAIATVSSYALSAFVANAFSWRTRWIFYTQLESLTFGVLRVAHR